jgi:hypothetical protein
MRMQTVKAPEDLARAFILPARALPELFPPAPGHGG